MTINYQLGKIYVLANSVDKTIYVGSTSQFYLCSRMTTHRTQSKLLINTSPLHVAMRLLGLDAFKILLHHVFPCSSKAELQAEEYRVLDEFIDAGRQVYNQMIRNKHSSQSKEKMSIQRRGNPSHFKHGSICLVTRMDYLSWEFRYQFHDHNQPYEYTQKSHSFGVTKYGFWEAKARCDELRKTIYPEYKDDEERCIEAFGNINLN